MDKKIGKEPRLAKGLRMMELNGSEYRSITSTRPNINTPITCPTRGSGQHEIKDTFSTKSYHHNDALTVASILLAEKAKKERREAVFITIPLDDKTSLKLRNQDADKNKETMIRSVSRWFRDYEHISDAIIVLEECTESLLPDMRTRRLHLHVFTVLNRNEQELVRRELLLGKRTRILVQTTWTDRRPYTSDDEWEEEEFGTMPKEKVDEGAEYWLNTYTREVVNKTTGKVSKEVCRVLPVCSRAVDYMTKDLERPIGRGKNYTILGLEGHRERRKKLARLGRELLAE